MEGTSSRRMMMVVAVVAVVAAAWMVAEGEAAVSCSTVSSDLGNCVSYATGQVTRPTSQCCSGVNSLYQATRAARSDRITACNCIKQLAQALGSKLSPSAISSLPGSCGVNLGYSISTSTNCNGIP